MYTYDYEGQSQNLATLRGFFIEIVPLLHQCPSSLLEGINSAENCCGSTVFSTGPEAATETISSSEEGLRRKHDGSFPSRLAREA